MSAPGTTTSDPEDRTEPGAAGAPAIDGRTMRDGMRVIVHAVRADPRNFAIGGAGAALYAGMIVAASIVLGRITDDVVLPAIGSGEVTTGALVGAFAAILVVSIVKAVGIFGRRLGAYLAQYRLQATYRNRVTRQFLRLPLVWHRRHTTGELLSNANADVEAAFFVAAPLPMAVGAALLVVLTAIVLVATDAFLAAVGFGVGPLLGIVNWRYQRRMSVAVRLAQQTRADVSGIAHESFDGALVVKTLGREKAETARFRQRSERLRDEMIHVGRLRASFDPLVEALPAVAILIVLLVGAWRVQQGALTPGALVQFAYLFRLVALPIRVFGWLLGELPRSVVGWQRVDRVLSATGEMRYGDVTASGEGGARTEAREVTYHHPTMVRGGLGDPVATIAEADPSTDGRRGVEGVTFDVKAGDVIAIVGPTGAGKSTIASMLVRLFDPDGGRVTLDGQDLRDLARWQLSRDVAIVFQESFIFDDTVRGNITLGEDLPDDRVAAAARLAQADGFIGELDHGYDTLVGERGATLSGGQRQRIALARALVRRPRLLVLDDATSACDPAVEAAILAGLRDAALPSTVVVVAYRKASIALADEVVFVADGRIQARGPHADLLRTVPAYRHLVTAYDQPGDAGASA